MAEWRIRVLGPEDAAVVLEAQVFDGPALAASTLRYLGAPGAPDARNLLVVAEVGARVVGFASGTILDHPDKPRMLYIAELGVEDDMQRRGIGRALLAAIRAEGRARGCRQSYVLTEGDNAAARALYRAEAGAETTDIVMFDWQEPD
jgi:ribosomal protein S18 acetylase RimI-like enzyme